MKSYQRILLLALALVCALGCLTLGAAAEETKPVLEYEAGEDGGIRIIRYNGSDEYVTIPTWLDGKKVTVIGEGAFEGNERIKHVVMPECVTEIEDRAFKGCVNLGLIKFPSKLKLIGEEAFSGCEKFNLTNDGEHFYNLYAIRDRAFENCKTLHYLMIGANITEIGQDIFEGCDTLVVVIDDNVRPGCVRMLDYLKEIQFPRYSILFYF